MRRPIILAALLVLGLAGLDQVRAALVVPNEIQQPGTQPGEVSNLESPNKCDNCHGGYNQAVEPAFNWRGSMMANAGRDPIFWATLAIAEQDFDGAGDLCIRCHSTGGWYAGRSTPTNGSALTAGDADGVDCDTCHKMTNPDQRGLPGVMYTPYVANDEQTLATGYYGSGMLSLSGAADKLGPYADADARHQFTQSAFHRDTTFCGSCHDVSNAAVGDLAPFNGAQYPLAADKYSGVLGAPVVSKAAFNNFPYQYGVVERTFSEYYSGSLSTTLVSNYGSLPADLKAGAVKAAYDSAKGDYADGTARYFSCQTCHVRAVTGAGANKPGLQTRSDLPLHDMTGGNYWMPDVIQYQNSQGTLRLGGGLTTTQISALNAGKDRALQQLDLAASLAVTGNTLKVTNLTGHKLISGYPEGRRMWLNVRWYDASDTLLREDGKYGIVATVNGTPVKSILNLDDPNTKIYQAMYGLTQEWAAKLEAIGYPATLPLGFDRGTGAVNYTLGALAAQAPGTSHETFHFVLNDTVVKDNRIPPYGMAYDDAKTRSTLPVPATQYGSPTAGGTFNYWDAVMLNPPVGAVYAEVRLLYQPTSWEYVQFLYRANDGSDPFLASEGVNLLNAWLATGMAEPHVMATTTWGTAPAPACTAPGTPGTLTAVPAKKSITLTWTASSPAPGGGYRVYYVQAGKLQLRASVGAAVQTYKDTGLTSRVSYTYVVTAWSDCNGNGLFDAGVDVESAVSNQATAKAG